MRRATTQQGMTPAPATTSSADPLAPAAARLPRERLEMLDVVRLAAAVGVIWIHTIESPRLARLDGLGRFAVPFFGAAAVLLMGQSLYANPLRRWGRFALGRAQRLLVPLWAWTVIYLVARNAKGQFVTGAGPLGWDWHNFIAGSAQHLWFLPALFAVSVALFPVQRFAARAGRAAGQLLAAIAVAAGVAWCLVPKQVHYAQDLMTVPGQFSILGSLTWDMVPALCWGLAAGVWFKQAPAVVRSRVVTVTGLIVASVATALVCRHGRQIALENVAGLGCLAFALGRWQGPWVDRLARLGALAYGIYLCHILWVQGFRAIAGKLGMAPAPWLDASKFAASTVLSILTAWGLSKSRATRWLVV